eukprot:c22235_g1_i2 orf=321-1817(+)
MQKGHGFVCEKETGEKHSEKALFAQEMKVVKETGEAKEGRPIQHTKPPLHHHPRHTSSKYDFVKVRVWLGDNADHYYVLSRFLMSRMLTVTKIPNHVAIKISLELKKLLIDNSLLDVSQSDLEANLFKLMERRGYGEDYINRYKMMTRFHHRRVPLVILVCGTACVGKSTIATQLAQRLNLPNVLQTDMVYELLRSSTDAPLTSTPIWEREFSSPEELVTEFCRECRIVRKGLDGDLKKAMKDGKPIIIEGIHVDPSIYLMDEGNQRVASAPIKSTAELYSDSATQKETTAKEVQTEPMNSSSSDAVHISITDKNIEGMNLQMGTPHASRASAKRTELLVDVSGDCTEKTQKNAVKNLKECPCPGSSDEVSTGITDLLENRKGNIHVGNSTEKQHLGSAKAIIVPIVLKMDEFDHKMLLEEWIACRSNNGVLITEAEEKGLMNNLMSIQEYLCSFESQGMTVVNISATTFPKTLDKIHSHLLQCIEEGCASHSQKDSS